MMKNIILFLVTAAAAPALAYPGGPCSGSWAGSYCICLDTGVCGSYGGVSYPGSPGDWPCPSDGANIQACFVSPCPGNVGSACMWANDCPTHSGPPVCPGGNDFICCAY